MFGAILGALGPVGWVAGAALTAATVVAASSGSSGGSSRRYSDEDEVKEEYKEKKIEKIIADIEAFSEKQPKIIQQKYNTEISILRPHVSAESLMLSQVTEEVFGKSRKSKESLFQIRVLIEKKDSTIDNEIQKGEAIINELTALKKALQKAKNEVLR